MYHSTLQCGTQALPSARHALSAAAGTHALHVMQEWTGEDSLGGALHAILPHLPNAQWLVTTLGGRGAVLLQRQEGQEASGEPALLDDVVNDLLQRVQEVASSQQSNTVCTSATGVSIGYVTACAKLSSSCITANVCAGAL